MLRRSPSLHPRSLSHQSSLLLPNLVLWTFLVLLWQATLSCKKLKSLPSPRILPRASHDVWTYGRNGASTDNLYTLVLTLNGQFICTLQTTHSCQPSRNGRDSPGIWPYVPVVSQVAWFNSNVLESSSIAHMGVWLKHKLSILASFGPYISIFSGRGSRNLGGVVQMVGVTTQKWAWSKNFHACFAHIPYFILFVPDSLLTNLATMQLLDYWLSKFVLETWESNGDHSHPKTLYAIQCGPQNLNTEGMHVVQSRSHTYFTSDWHLSW